MVEGNLKGENPTPSVERTYKIGIGERLFGWGLLLTMGGLLAWESLDLRKAYLEVHRLEMLFTRSPVTMGILTLALLVALWIPAAFIWAFVGEQIRRSTLLGSLEAAEKVQDGKGHCSLSLIISGIKYSVFYEEDLERYIRENSIIGRRVRIDLRGGKRVYSLSTE